MLHHPFPPPLTVNIPVLCLQTTSDDQLNKSYSNLRLGIHTLRTAFALIGFHFCSHPHKLASIAVNLQPSSLLITKNNIYFLTAESYASRQPTGGAIAYILCSTYTLCGETRATKTPPSSRPSCFFATYSSPSPAKGLCIFL